MKKLLILAALLASPAEARDRSVTVTSFDRVRIVGNFIVEITTGRGPTARISGSEVAIERTNVAMQGQTLTIGTNHNAWGGMPDGTSGPATVRLTTQFLRAAAVTGSAAVTIDAMRAASVVIALEGSGRLTVAGIESDALDIGLAGSGSMTLSGKAAGARAVVRGTATLAAADLIVRDAKVIGETAGTIALTAAKTANVVATGAGDTVITGSPACTVANRGSGTVRCGKTAKR